MRQGAGKTKGAQFERDIARKLSLWVTDGQKEDVFWRSAMSGGRATIGMRKGIDLSRQAGDITAVAPEGHRLTSRYFIELKHYRHLAIDRFIIGSTGPLAGFWRICIKEAHKHGLKPMLIFRQNHFPTLVLTERDLTPHYIPKTRVKLTALDHAVITDLDSLLQVKAGHVLVTS